MRNSKFLSTIVWAFVGVLCTCMGLNISSCGSREEDSTFREVVVDVDQIVVVEIDTTRLMPLETTSQSLLYNVRGLNIIEGNYYVSSVDMLKAFDHNGRFIREISSKGHGPEEYLGLKQVATLGDTILIFDNVTPKIMRFDMDGSFISSIRIPNETVEHGRKPNLIVFGDYGDYRLTRNGWTDHTSESNPMFSIYSLGWDYIGDLHGREMRNGEYIPDMFAVDNDKKIVYYWEIFNDTIFVLNSEGIYPRFVLNYGRHSVPSDIMELNSTYERLSAIAKRGETECVTNARSFQVYDKYLFFTISSFSNKTYLCVLDTESFDTKVFDFLSVNRRYSLNPIIALNEDILYVNLTDNIYIEANPLLYPLAIQSLI